MLEDAEFSFGQGQLEPIFEVVMRIQNLLLVILLVGDRVSWHLQPRLDTLLDVWPMEVAQVFVLPVELIETKVLDALGVIQLITKCWQDSSPLVASIIEPVLMVLITVRAR